jgi:ribosomal protein S18 acetylase RimI-like enzyme
MIIRFAEKTDLENIARLYVRNHRTTYRGLLSDNYLDRLTVDGAYEKWEAYLYLPDSAIWVACEGDSFLGFSAGKPDPEISSTWYLETLQIAENSRGKGHGTALIRTNAEHASEQGFQKMSICIVRGNHQAEELYRRLGAVHYAFFEDDFCGTVSSSEKLIWNELPTW